jgi:hypothetical protein
MRRSARVAAAFLIALGAAAGCAKPPPAAQPSGFLGNYAGFEPHPTRPGALRYRRPGADLGDYDRVLIDPVAVALRPDSAGRSVNPEDLARLARYMHDALAIALRKRYPVVDEPGPGILRVRVGITDLVPAQPVLNTAETVLGARIASSASRAISGTDLFVGEVAIEAEIRDSASGERLGALVDRKFGDRFALQQGATTWGHVEQAFRDWAVDFRIQMDREHTPESGADES